MPNALFPLTQRIRTYIGASMRTKGLEPSLLSELEPKSSASTNSATSAEIYKSIVAQPEQNWQGKIFFTYPANSSWGPKTIGSQETPKSFGQLKIARTTNTRAVLLPRSGLRIS